MDEVRDEKGKRCYGNSTGVVKNVRIQLTILLVHFHWKFFLLRFVPFSLLISHVCVIFSFLHSSFTISPISSFILKSMKVLLSLPSIRACLSWMNINEQKRKRFDLFHPLSLFLSTTIPLFPYFSFHSCLHIPLWYNLKQGGIAWLDFRAKWDD